MSRAAGNQRRNNHISDQMQDFATLPILAVTAKTEFPHLD